MTRIRVKAIGRRWVEILLLSSAAYGVASGIIALTRACERLAALPWWTFVPVLAVALPFAIKAAAETAWGWSGLRHVTAYPPPWIAALVATALLVWQAALLKPTSLARCGIDPSWRTIWSPFLVFAGAGLLGALLLSQVVRWDSRRRDRSAVKHRLGLQGDLGGAHPVVTSRGLSEDFDTLKEWLATDRPVTDPAHDVFGRNSTALRVVEYLRNAARPSVALVGPVGSGKTTVGALATHELLRSGELGERVEIATVSLWPYDSVEAALRGLLTTITGVLARHVNTAPLIGLSSEYAEAVEALGGKFVLASTLRGARSPSAVLRVYDRACSAIGLRIVLWVEDIERFSGTASRGAGRDDIAPVRAFLSELGGCDSMQVVLALSATAPAFDLEKLARFVEPLQPISEDSTLSVLRAFRAGCLLEYPSIDPVQSDVREKFWPKELNPEQLKSRRAYGLMSEDRALATLCSTPRTLKQGLRSCYDAWRILHGEIDFDDLLVMSLLRVAEPEVFALVNEHINDLQHGVRRDEEERNKPTPFASRVAAALGERSSGLRLAAETLIGTVFPLWKTGASSDVAFKPQGLAQVHTSYWERYVGLVRPPDESSDQRTLQTILKWKNEGDSVLVHEVVAGTLTGSAVPFAQQLLSGKDLLRLLEDVVAAELQRSPATWSDDIAPSLKTVRFMNGRAAITQQEAIPVVTELVEISVCPNLALAHALLYNFVRQETSQVVQVIEDREKAQTIVGVFHRTMVVSFANSPVALVESLRGSPVPTLLWSCWGLDRHRRKQYSEPPFEEWPRFSKAVLDAAEIAPEVVLPQLALLPVDVLSVMPGIDEGNRLFHKYVFDADRAGRLFDLPRLYSLFRANAELKVHTDASPFFAECVRAARDAATP